MSSREDRLEGNAKEMHDEIAIKVRMNKRIRSVGRMGAQDTWWVAESCRGSVEEAWSNEWDETMQERLTRLQEEKKKMKHGSGDKCRKFLVKMIKSARSGARFFCIPLRSQSNGEVDCRYWRTWKKM